MHSTPPHPNNRLRDESIEVAHDCSMSVNRLRPNLEDSDIGRGSFLLTAVSCHNRIHGALEDLCSKLFGMQSGGVLCCNRYWHVAVIVRRWLGDEVCSNFKKRYVIKGCAPALCIPAVRSVDHCLEWSSAGWRSECLPTLSALAAAQN